MFYRSQNHLRQQDRSGSGFHAWHGRSSLFGHVSHRTTRPGRGRSAVGVSRSSPECGRADSRLVQQYHRRQWAHLLELQGRGLAGGKYALKPAEYAGIDSNKNGAVSLCVLVRNRVRHVSKTDAVLCGFSEDGRKTAVLSSFLFSRILRNGKMYGVFSTERSTIRRGRYGTERGLPTSMKLQSVSSLNLRCPLTVKG